MTTEEARAADKQADKQADAIAVDVLAAMRAERGEYLYATRAEVVAFATALPSEMRAQWTAPTMLLGGGGYRVTFWRPSPLWSAFTRPASGKETASHDG